jgi:hypothetical protein
MANTSKQKQIDALKADNSKLQNERSNLSAGLKEAEEINHDLAKVVQKQSLDILRGNDNNRNLTEVAKKYYHEVAESNEVLRAILKDNLKTNELVRDIVKPLAGLAGSLNKMFNSK